MLWAPEEGNFSFDESRTNNITQVSDEENTFPTTTYSEYEVKEAVFRKEHKKATGLDDFPVEFYHHF
jgi:hypothetical protein